MSIGTDNKILRPTGNACVLSLLAAVLLAFVPSARADIGFVNGGFELTTNGAGQLGYNTNATGWSTDGYNFLFTPGSADTTFIPGQYGGIELWGPGNGSPNGLPATSPDGGNYIGADGAFQVGAITQTVTGLKPGDLYNVSFFWAGAQQLYFVDANTEQWVVSLGGQTQSTPVLSNANEGFTGWRQQSFTFAADNTSDVLSFLAVGTPNGGAPPFSLLDGVSMTDVSPTPEPAFYGIVLIALAILVFVKLRMNPVAAADRQ